jgi:hypothetical protein
MSKRFIYYGSFASVVAPYFSNLFGMPAAAYSLRKLTPNATNCIRVRRSSDNTEQDIGFVANVPDSPIDTTALLAFVGAGNGFVTTWYDQSTSGNNVLQTTAGSQPRIVSSGVVDIENAEAAISFNGTSQWFNGGNILSMQTSNDLATFAVARTLSTSNSDVFFKGFAQSEINRFSLTFTFGTTTSFVVNNSNVDVRASVSGILTTQQIYNTEFIRNTSNRLLRNNTQVAINTSTVGVIGTNSSNFTIGVLLNNTLIPNRYFNGRMQEIIIYQQPSTPSISTLNTNINTYYNVF